MKRTLFYIALFLCTPGPLAAKPVCIISYNVENLFDARHDTLKQDMDFTPDGLYRWTPSRFRHKAKQIAHVINSAGGWSTPLLVGLCEVENDACLRQLMHNLPHHPYRYLHSESPDVRGIDVALLYDTTRFRVLVHEALPVCLDSLYTRDILYVKGVVGREDTLHVMVCHLPSMRGGKAQSEWKRHRARSVVQHRADSLLALQPDARIIVMGDMNSAPENNLRGLKNLMLGLDKRWAGTYKYQGEWSFLDQFYLSPALVRHSFASVYAPDFLLERDRRYTGWQPLRTFRGPRYNPRGYSDHLPVILEINW